eukprot:1156723-Pelagomonas_calceolata.AAC.16
MNNKAAKSGKDTELLPCHPCTDSKRPSHETHKRVEKARKGKWVRDAGHGKHSIPLARLQ